MRHPRGELGYRAMLVDLKTIRFVADSLISKLRSQSLPGGGQYISKTEAAHVVRYIFELADSAIEYAEEE